MKRIITLFTLLIFSGLILPSCGITIVKRQHRGGYYVSKNSHYRVDKDEAVIKTDENQAVTTAKPVVEAEELEVAEAPVIINEEENAVNVPSLGKQNDEAPAKSVEASSTKRVFSLNSMTEKVPVMKKMDSTLKKVKAKSNAPASDEELSLLWIVILILLILWAVGLIGGGWGLGGLINILLVIALVLLILWLLRVI